MSMKKFSLGVIIISLLSFAIAKSSLWYFTQQFVDNLITQSKPFVQITYNDIKTSLTGSASVNKIKIFNPSLNENITIESIQFLAPDLITLLTLDSQLQQKQLPESLSLLISGMSIDLDSPLINILDDPNIEPAPLDVFSTLACGDIQKIGGQALSQMGYDSLTTDITLKYEYNPRRQVLSYSLQNNIRDMSQVNLSGEIHNVIDLNSFANNTAHPGKTRLEIIDNSYIQQKNKYCAYQGKLEINEYINEHLLQLKEYLSSYGVEPEEGLFSAYKTLLNTSGSVKFEADLSQLQGMNEITSFEPNDLIQFIRFKLFINSQRIEEISIHIDKDKLVRATTGNKDKLETPAQIKKKQSLIIKKYHPASVASLINYNGHRVKVQTRDGKHFKGTLNTEDPTVYEIISRRRSGNISYHLKISRIQSAEVFY